MRLEYLKLISKAGAKDRISQIKKTGLALEFLGPATGSALLMKLLTAFATDRSLLLEMPSKSIISKRIKRERRGKMIGRPKQRASLVFSRSPGDARVAAVGPTMVGVQLLVELDPS